MPLVLVGNRVRFVHGEEFLSWPIRCLGEEGETDSESENAYYSTSDLGRDPEQEIFLRCPHINLGTNCNREVSSVSKFG